MDCFLRLDFSKEAICFFNSSTFFMHCTMRGPTGITTRRVACTKKVIRIPKAKNTISLSATMSTKVKIARIKYE